MGQQSLELVVRHLRRLASRNGVAELSDAQLLERFSAEREELAFTHLMQRHGPMVLSVCRRVLGQDQDAEDAFQAKPPQIGYSWGQVHEYFRRFPPKIGSK
jgi:hypothetical protein